MPSNDAQFISDEDFERELNALEEQQAQPAETPMMPDQEISEAAAPAHAQADATMRSGSPNVTVSLASTTGPLLVAGTYMGLGPYPAAGQARPQVGAHGAHFGDSNKNKSKEKPSNSPGGRSLLVFCHSDSSVPKETAASAPLENGTHRMLGHLLKFLVLCRVVVTGYTGFGPYNSTPIANRLVCRTCLAACVSLAWLHACHDARVCRR